MRKNRKSTLKYYLFCFTLLLLVISVSWFLCHISSNDVKPKNNKRIYKIGAILPLSGEAAIAGKNTQKGIELAIKHLNTQHPDDSIIVIYEDTKGLAKFGVSSVNKLIEFDKVEYIIDNSISSVTLAVAPIINKNEVILLATGASSPKITNAGKHIFRIWNSDTEEAKSMASFIQNQKNIKKILVIYTNNEYGIGLKDAFLNYIDSTYNIKTVAFNDNLMLPEIDFKNFDATYIIGHSKETIYASKYAINNGFHGIFLGTSVMLDPNVQSNFVKYKNKTFYPISKMPDSTNVTCKKFLEEFKNTYNTDPVPLADVGYDAVLLFYQSINRGEGNRIFDKIIDYFNSGSMYWGASGKIQFDKKGDVHKPIIINQLKK